MKEQISTPDFSHITAEDLNHIYEPSEDSFLLIDTLEKELELIEKIKPEICMEVGSGSGVVLTALGTTLGESCQYLATDINPKACHITKETGRRNGVTIQVIECDLVSGVPKEFNGKVDILLFNPPYVVTPSAEVGQGDLEYTWAGGVNGREVMDRLFPLVSDLLSTKGLFYLIVLKENKPEDIEKVLSGYGFSCVNVMSRKTGPEHLSVLRFRKKD